MNALVDLWMSPDEHLFHIVQSDDLVLKQSGEAVWFQLIKNIFQHHQLFHSIAVRYYRSTEEFKILNWRWLCSGDQV